MTGAWAGADGPEPESLGCSAAGTGTASGCGARGGGAEGTAVGTGFVGGSTEDMSDCRKPGGA
eukprot:945844-Rhodomonas_salina.1